MTLRAIIIDDEQKGIDTLQILIQNYLAEQVKIVAVSRQPEAAIELIENYHPEIIFLDINMPQLNGFQLLERLNWRNFHLVFTTAHQEFALQALREKAFDYLLKPIDHEELLACVQRIIKRIIAAQQIPSNIQQLLDQINGPTKAKLLINSKEGMEYVELSTILYLESDSNYTLLHLQDGRSILSPRTLKDYEVELVATSDFMRVHHSFVINLQKVNRYLKPTEEIVLQNDQRIPVSKSRKTDFLDWLEK